jgi:hypothetical protein
MRRMSFRRRHVTALLALVLLASVPAAAEARSFKVEGRVTGPPTAKRGAVTIPLQLTPRAGRAVKVGTRRVRVRFKRVRLPLAGAPGAARVAPRALRAGDRLRGVTSLSKKARRRLRYRARPTLKLRRVRVVRRARRGLGRPAPPGLALPGRTPEQIVMDIGTRATAVSGRIGELGSLGGQVARLQALALPLGIAGVTVALEPLTAALESRASTDPDFEPLLARVEALSPGGEWLGTSMGAIDTSVRITRTVATIGDAVEVLALQAPVLAAQIELLSQIPGLLAQVTAIEDVLIRIDGRLAALERATAALDDGTGPLNAGMASLAGAADALAADAQGGADVATMSAGVDALEGDFAALEGDFGALQASLDEAGPALDGLDADAAALEAMVEALEGLGMGAG